MPGGPINGVPRSAAIPGGAAIALMMRRGTKSSNSEDYTGIIIPTVLQMASDALAFWTNLTCLYDPYHVADPDKVTLPICMFNVVDIAPVYSVESSKKRIILYEPQGNTDPSNPFRENVMRSIIDNSVKQPTTYNMEIIVPFQPIGRYITENVKAIGDMVSGFDDFMGKSETSGLWESTFSSVLAATKAVQTAAEIVGKLPMMDGVSYININSLEAMAASCRTLCMKMWTGLDYKYVQITNMTHKKKGTEDDVFRATLTLQEKPVLAVSPPEDTVKKSAPPKWIVQKTTEMYKKLTSPLVDVTGIPDVTSAVSKAALLMR